ncbi:MAG: HEAT repeat domain-containing protein, partial [Planctomycetia bacterium]|nr:HEAT repeat domain-containing protein [Planctomycetia bacterium]
LQPYWLPEVVAGKPALGDRAGHLVFALGAVGSADAVTPLLKALNAGTISPEQEEKALGLIATLGQARELSEVFALASAEGPRPSARRAALLNGLIKAARQRKVRPEVDHARLLALLSSPDDALRAAVAQAAGAWKLEPARERLEALAGAADTADPVRQAAVEALAELGGPRSRQVIESLTGDESPRGARRIALGVLATIDPRAAAGRAADWLARTDDPAEAEDLVARFARLRNGPAALASALSGKALKPDVAKLSLRAGRDHPALAQALRKAGGLGDVPLITLGALPGSGAEVGATGFARFQVDVSTPGPVRLALDSPRGLSVWVDGTSVEPRESLDLDLNAGLHTVTLAVRRAERTEGLRCTLDDVPGSPARAQVVVGR